jgi:hypothetical protein
MNKLVIVVALFFHLLSCCASGHKNSIRIVNTGLNDLTDYAVVLSRHQIEQKLGTLVKSDIVYASFNGVAIPSQ